MLDYDTDSQSHWSNRALAAEPRPIPRVGPLEAARRYWLLVLLPVLVLVPVVGVIAGTRSAKYTAESRLMVGRLNISTPGAVQGYAQAAQDLASTYPLVIDANGVVNPIARQFRTTPGAVRGALTASQVPTSSIVRVDATTHSAASAVALANAAANSLVTYLTNINRTNPEVSQLYKQVQRASLAFQRIQASAAPHGRSKPTPSQLAAVQSAKVRLNGATQTYQLELQNQASTSLLQPLQYASSATSDRTSKLEISLFAALVAGVIIGLALATLRANADLRKAYSRANWSELDRSLFEPDAQAAGASAGDADTVAPPADDSA
jgi:capsular polysaccharide biosynthesis protein